MRAISQLMESRGITVEQVAEACGHRPQTIARWLRGEGHGFGIDEAESIRTKLFPDLSIEELFESIVTIK